MLAIFLSLSLSLSPSPNNNILRRANVVAGTVCSSVSSAVIEFATVPRRFIAHSRPNARHRWIKSARTTSFFPRLRTTLRRRVQFPRHRAYVRLVCLASAEIIVYTLRTRVASAPTNEKERENGRKSGGRFEDKELKYFRRSFPFSCIYIYIYLLYSFSRQGLLSVIIVMLARLKERSVLYEKGRDSDRN